MYHNLSELKIGESGTVSNITTTGSMRRRLLDLGVVEGTSICCLHKSPSGSPVAYTIRGAVIALRTDDSKNILITCSNDE
ncbi:MAG: FeoA family protein [bacterium]|nr:FeoA family protein [bacterium]